MSACNLAVEQNSKFSLASLFPEELMKPSSSELSYMNAGCDAIDMICHEERLALRAGLVWVETVI